MPADDRGPAPKLGSDGDREAASRRRDEAPGHQNRARGELRATFRRAGSRTEPGRLFESGGYRLRLPRSRDGCEAVIVNTGGGMAGGDHLRAAFAAAAGAAVTITTTAAEKIYRAEGADTGVEARFEVASGGRLDWLPQETILFDGARLDRRLDAEVAADGHLLVAEMLVFGRLAMGETMRAGRLADRWRIRRDGKLVFAENLVLDGDIRAALDRPALGDGARAAATLVLVSPDAEGRLDAVRAALPAPDDPEIAAGASAWNGLLTVRALSPSPAKLRSAIVRALTAVRGRSLPRTWL